MVAPYRKRIKDLGFVELTTLVNVRSETLIKYREMFVFIIIILNRDRVISRCKQQFVVICTMHT